MLIAEFLVKVSYVSEVECVQEVARVVRLPEGEGGVGLGGGQQGKDSGFQHDGTGVFDLTGLSMMIYLNLMFNCVVWTLYTSSSRWMILSAPVLLSELMMDRN